MTRPNLLVGALAAVCVGTLLWCARLIVAADLPLGAHVASWALWLVSTAAVVTLLAYLREFLSHRQAVGRDASWKPLPSLVLLWIGGLTALVSFAFILPDKSSSEGSAQPAKAGAALTAQTVTSVSASTTSAPGLPRPAATSSTSSRSVASRTAPPAPVSTTAPRSTSAGGATAPRATTTTATTTATPSSTSSPIIDISILPTPPPSR